MLASLLEADEVGGEILPAHKQPSTTSFPSANPLGSPDTLSRFH